jgi:radical SAM superfamily enzyme YgiQ (UPF0313 family)
MKLVLTHGYFLADDSKELEIMRPYPTLGLLYISSYLKAEGKDVSIVDSTFLSKEEWKAELVKLQPGLVAFYSNLMTKLNILELNRWLKSALPNTVTLVGGPDVTYNIEHYLNAGFDYTVSGEGEQTVLELSNAVEQQSAVSEIQGIAYKATDGEIIRNEARTKIKELETLPFPDRGSIPIEKYLDVWKTHHGKRTLNISTQRGCPYTCKWCSTAVYGQSYRRNDPERVVAEILDLKDRFDVEALWFVDDVFTVSHKWIADLHAAFQRHNLTIDFECITRAERLNATVLQQLKEMGCFRIWIGAESGSQRIIDRMDRRVSLETVQATMQQTRALGMEAGTFIMVGYPGEELEDIQQTMEHIKACNPHLLTITKAYPIKGTGLYAEIENDITTVLDWQKSTDRDIRFPLPYSDKFYNYSIRYLVNGWLAHRDQSLKHRLKSRAALALMKWSK